MFGSGGATVNEFVGQQGDNSVSAPDVGPMMAMLP